LVARKTEGKILTLNGNAGANFNFESREQLSKEREMVSYKNSE